MNSEQQKLIEDNKKLVHYFAKHFNAKTKEQYDECADIGLNGLIKAALTYDKSKNIKFNTYAGTCIRNEIGMLLRKKTKEGNTISLDDIISKEDDNIILEDVIAYTENFDEVENRELFIKATKMILNYLSYTEVIVMLYRAVNITRDIIMEVLGIKTKTTISKIENRAKSKLKAMYSEDLKDNESIYIDVISNYYVFLFSYKTIADINSFLKSLFKYLKTIDDLPYFRIARHKEYIKIYLIREPESFVTIAKIIQEFSNFIIVGTKSDLCKKTNNVEEEKKLTPRDIIREYIFSKDSFTIKEIQKHFLSKIDLKTVSSTVYVAMTKGLITKSDDGKYIVNKN